MQKPLTFLASLAVATCFALPGLAQDEPGPDTVVAVVNGTEITLGHMIVARASLPEQYQQLPDQVLFDGILEQLIQQTALAATFEGELPVRAQISLENERRSITAGEVVEQIMAKPVSEEELTKAYQEGYGDVDPEEEYNASHILVETEEEAKAIKAEIEAGADFATVAREKSTGPSGPGGGSLGWFGKGMMVPSFEAAVVAMSVGDISEPVKTQFGWHVITLNEKRNKDVPTIDDVREELELQVRQVRAQEAIESVTAEAEVDATASEGMDHSLIKNIEWLE